MLYAAIAILAISCIVPFINVLAVSLSSRLAVQTNQVTFWPIGLHWENYAYVVARSQFVMSLTTSLGRVVFGVALESSSAF